MVLREDGLLYDRWIYRSGLRASSRRAADPAPPGPCRRPCAAPSDRTVRPSFCERAKQPAPGTTSIHAAVALPGRHNRQIACSARWNDGSRPGAHTHRGCAEGGGRARSLTAREQHVLLARPYPLRRARKRACESARHCFPRLPHGRAGCRSSTSGSTSCCRAARAAPLLVASPNRRVRRNGGRGLGRT